MQMIDDAAIGLLTGYDAAHNLEKGGVILSPMSAMNCVALTSLIDLLKPCKAPWTLTPPPRKVFGHHGRRSPADVPLIDDPYRHKG